LSFVPTLSPPRRNKTMDFQMENCPFSYLFLLVNSNFYQVSFETQSSFLFQNPFPFLGKIKVLEFPSCGDYLPPLGWFGLIWGVCLERPPAFCHRTPPYPPPRAPVLWLRRTSPFRVFYSRFSFETFFLLARPLWSPLCTTHLVAAVLICRDHSPPSI